MPGGTGWKRRGAQNHLILGISRELIKKAYPEITFVFLWGNKARVLRDVGY